MVLWWQQRQPHYECLGSTRAIWFRYDVYKESWDGPSSHFASSLVFSAHSPFSLRASYDYCSSNSPPAAGCPHLKRKNEQGEEVKMSMKPHATLAPNGFGRLVVQLGVCCPPKLTPLRSSTMQLYVDNNGSGDSQMLTKTPRKGHFIRTGVFKRLPSM